MGHHGGAFPEEVTPGAYHVQASLLETYPQGGTQGAKYLLLVTLQAEGHGVVRELT